LSKPFHVDEFYSWIYAERCSFQEILTLKDKGIGHPPFFHLIQKTVQWILPEYRPYQVRLANYFIGLGFLILLIGFLEKKNSVPIFYYGIASSACILNVFVFSRMWGLVCLFSMLLIWAGENFLKDGNKCYLAMFLSMCILGFLADYNFILLIPYMVIVCISKSHTIKYLGGNALVGLLLIFLSGILIVSALRMNNSLIGFYILNSIPKLFFEAGFMIFNFWYVETYLMAVLVLCLIYYLNSKEKQEEGSNWRNWSLKAGVAISILIISEMLIRYAHVRTRYLALVIIGVVCYLLFDLIRKMKKVAGEDEERYINSIIFGILILLAANPFMWTDLIMAKFIIILLPLCLILIYRSLQRKYMKWLCVLFITSGILYSSSNALSDWTSAPAIRNKENVVYHSMLTYADQYLRIDKMLGTDSYIIDMNDFDKYCRICRSGKSNIEYDNYNKLNIVGSDFYEAEGAVARDFCLRNKSDIGLTKLDKIQKNYFTAIPHINMMVYEFVRK